MRKFLIFLSVACFILPSFAQADQELFTLHNGQLDSGSVMRRYDILFDLQKATLRPEDSIVLDSIADWMILHPEFTIEVGNHADYVSPASAMRLSVARANAVRDYLVSKHVQTTKITAVGYNDSRNIIPRSQIEAVKTPGEKAALGAINRRTEFKIVRIEAKLMHLFTLEDSVFWPGEVFRNYNIIYDLNRPSLLPQSLPYLDTIINFLKAHAQMKMEISCHTDTRGSYGYNHKLSKMRADWVADYFIQQGIAAERIIVKSYGESLPIVPEAEVYQAPTKQAQEELHRQNRRTEFKIISVQ